MFTIPDPDGYLSASDVNSERELCVPLAVAVSYQNGDCGKHGEVVRGYVACGVGEKSPKQVERLYRKRSGIETSYRLFRQARGITTHWHLQMLTYSLLGLGPESSVSE